MEINKDTRYDKPKLLNYFRSRAKEILAEIDLEWSATEYKKKTSEFNKAIAKSRDSLISLLETLARDNRWNKTELLESALMIYYTSDVVMLEVRNEIWQYDYMSFSRRIGELWEPFCKLCFRYPLHGLMPFIPPLFSDVRRDLEGEICIYVEQLHISVAEKEQLLRYYDKVWGLVSAGEIKLECDLHFIKGRTRYVVDFKSGFGSNEKGNTNRLLLVGSIYRNIERNSYKCMIFVRAIDNNHYFTTLKSSGVWDVFTGEDTYREIMRFTGFDIAGWIARNIDWMEDFSYSMRQTIVDQNLERYLIW